MNVVVASRHMEVTPALKSFAEQKVSKLTKYYDRIQEIEVVIDAGKDLGKDSTSVEVIVNAEHKNMFVAHHTDGDAYMCIDACVNKLERQLSDHKKMVRNRKQTDASEVKKSISDPAAKKNLAQNSKGTLDTIAAQLNAFDSHFGAQGRNSAELTSTEMQKLASLGYVGLQKSASRPGTEATGIDPKDGIDAANKVFSSAALLNDGKPGDVVRILQPAISALPNSYLAQYTLGAALAQQQQYAAAIGRPCEDVVVPTGLDERGVMDAIRRYDENAALVRSLPFHVISNEAAVR